MNSKLDMFWDVALLLFSDLISSNESMMNIGRGCSLLGAAYKCC